MVREQVFLCGTLWHRMVVFIVKAAMETDSFEAV